MNLYMNINVKKDNSFIIVIRVVNENRKEAPNPIVAINAKQN